MKQTRRHWLGSQSFRVMAWLAWLMLVALPVHGAPPDMMGGPHSAGHVSSVTQDAAHCQHHASVKVDRCCGDHDDHCCHGSINACQCVTVCSSALPVTAMTLPMSVMPDAQPSALLRIAAPSVVHAPPLRPPAV
ncbi:MAG: hypothetical protein ABI227_09880 [Rhodanobacter sp.]